MEGGMSSSLWISVLLLIEILKAGDTSSKSLKLKTQIWVKWAKHTSEWIHPGFDTHGAELSVVLQKGLMLCNCL